jgi:hypothetical protein
MGRFETEWRLDRRTSPPGWWIDKVHTRRPPRVIVLDMDSSKSPTYGAQVGSAYNGHFNSPIFSITRAFATQFSPATDRPRASRDGLERSRHHISPQSAALTP